jgi:hypothetical protein
MLECTRTVNNQKHHFSHYVCSPHRDALIASAPLLFWLCFRVCCFRCSLQSGEHLDLQDLRSSEAITKAQAKAFLKSREKYERMKSTRRLDIDTLDHSLMP